MCFYWTWCMCRTKIYCSNNIRWLIYCRWHRFFTQQSSVQEPSHLQMCDNNQYLMKEHSEADYILNFKAIKKYNNVMNSLTRSLILINWHVSQIIKPIVLRKSLLSFKLRISLILIICSVFLPKKCSNIYFQPENKWQGAPQSTKISRILKFKSLQHVYWIHQM